MVGPGEPNRSSVVGEGCEKGLLVILTDMALTGTYAEIIDASSVTTPEASVSTESRI